MASTSTTHPHRYTPAWRTGVDAPVFLIRAGSVIERGALESELAGEHRAGRVFAYELQQAFQEGVSVLLGDGDDARRLIELAQAEAALENGEKLDEADRQLLSEARTELGQHWPDCRALVARMERRRELAPIVAFRRFCVGWENVTGSFARGLGGVVTDEALTGVDPLDLIGAGNFAYSLLYTVGEERNFQPPSKSGDSPPPSPSVARTPEEDGKSKVKSGRKTPA